MRLNLNVFGASTAADSPDTGLSLQLRALAWVYLAVGVSFGALAPRLGEVKRALQVTNGSYGTAVAIGGTGAIVGTWLSGFLAHRIGSKRVVAITAPLSAWGGFALAEARSVQQFGLFSLVTAVLASATFLLLSDQGVRVQHALGRSVLPQLQALVSLGTLMAAAASSLSAEYVTPAAAAGVAATLGSTTILMNARKLLPRSVGQSPTKDSDGAPLRYVLGGAVLLLLSVAALAQALSGVAEAAVGDWSSILLSQDFHLGRGLAGAGFATFVLVQLFVRLGSGRLVGRLGMRVAVQRLGVGGALAYGIFLLLADAANDPRVVLAFTCASYGSLAVASCLVPAAFTAAVSHRAPGSVAQTLTIMGTLTALFLALGRLSLARLTDVAPLPWALAGLSLGVLLAISMSAVIEKPARVAEAGRNG